MAARAIDGVFYFLERQRRKFGVEQKVAPAVCRWSRAVARRNCAIMKALSTMRTMATRKIILQDVQHEALHHTRAMVWRLWKAQVRDAKAMKAHLDQHLEHENAQRAQMIEQHKAFLSRIITLQTDASFFGSERCKQCIEFYGDESSAIMSLIQELRDEVMKQEPEPAECACACVGP